MNGNRYPLSFLQGTVRRALSYRQQRRQFPGEEVIEGLEGKSILARLELFKRSYARVSCIPQLAEIIPVEADGAAVVLLHALIEHFGYGPTSAVSTSGPCKASTDRSTVRVKTAPSAML